VEKSFASMLYVATLALSAATYFGSARLWVLVAAFFAFEGCVGLYFPSIGNPINNCLFFKSIANNYLLLTSILSIS